MGRCEFHRPILMLSKHDCDRFRRLDERVDHPLHSLGGESILEH